MAVELNHRIVGSGPHVLLLHAVGMDSTFLEPLAAILAKDFTVLTVDMRGHGKSPFAPSTGLADYADDIHALLTKLKFAPCGGCGLRDGRPGDAGAGREIPAGCASRGHRERQSRSRRRRASRR